MTLALLIGGGPTAPLAAAVPRAAGAALGSTAPVTLAVASARPAGSVRPRLAPSASRAFTAAVMPPVRFTPQLTDRLAATLARLRATYHLPGLQAAIRYPGGTGWQGHAGFGDLAAH